MDKVSSNYKNYKIKYSKNDEIIKEILENDLLDLVMIFFLSRSVICFDFYSDSNFKQIDIVAK